MNIKSVALAVLLAASAGASHAAIISVPGVIENLEVGTTYDIYSFNVVGYAGGAATLSFNYGLWSGPGGTEISLLAQMNAADVALPFSFSNGYFSPPARISFDVSSLLGNGSNLFSVLGSLVTGGPTSYAVGDLELAYDEMAPIPLPASLPILFGSLMLLAAAARRRSGGVGA